MTKAKSKRPVTKKPVAKKRPAKKPGVISDLSASAEPLSIYAGNSARVDEAREAYERAEAWAQAPAGTKYGSTKGNR